MRGSEDNLVELVLSFHLYMGPRIDHWALVIGLVHQVFYPLSHLTYVHLVHSWFQEEVP